MERKEIAWTLTRAAGVWMQILAIQMLPTLALALPEMANILLSWDTLMEHHTLLTLFSHGPVAHSGGILSRLGIYLVAGFYLMARGESLIRLLSKA
ncbi:hypothetical protein [Parendozoicomonas haliclonae]|uniref:Uncharacterized protein n=1 Tax=Parendozoicomonas haliclonae TaxID=1960125 RepID=A0A1X7AGJ4_9GAMM|nr:hypothetical protein [Parendozoicomonas haliclonae]SMA40222.1 hypothetical protein EHSB41UT_01156 [Parendozoicomonas haliclonae]